MAIMLKLYQHKRKDLEGKWYGRTVKTGEVNIKKLAESISHSCSMTESDVYGVVTALVSEMSNRLRDGNTVVLDGFGRFHLTVKSDMVADKDEYDIKKHVRRVLCKFTPSATRDQFTHKLVRPFCEEVEIKRWKW